MLNLTLTTQSGKTQDLNLPLRVEDIVQRPMPFYLAYGKATATFETPDADLNEKLGSLMPNAVEGGVQELNLLAYILDRMDEKRLALLRGNLPDEPCDITELTRRANYFCDRYLDRDGNPDPYVVPLERYRESSSLSEKLQREFRMNLEKQRMTGGQLFDRIIEQAKENGDLARFDAIDEYILDDTSYKGKLCSYEFDLLPAMNFGGSEGIYIDCYLKGKFDESGRDSLHIGTIKTLDTNLDACKVMGELCGALMYHENRFVNENLYLFDSTESIERMITKSMEIEQQITDPEMQMGQQM
ncbi:hypothetical protein ACRQV7_13270 [Caproiciproducens sp. R2]|uniref:hypothetical protein n=1 Tax=Caproiciproducens sp. R2 TaxID=3435187 RepID=UPI0040344230